MIIASAVKFFYKEDTEHKFPQIWTGLRHSDIFERMFKLGVEYDKDSHVQGFVTNTNHFLDRFDAYEYAIDCGQLSAVDESTVTLYSEDIWPE